MAELSSQSNLSFTISDRGRTLETSTGFLQAKGSIIAIPKPSIRLGKTMKDDFFIILFFRGLTL